MKCQTCKLGSGSLIDMAPGRDPSVLHCLSRDCKASVTLNDLGFQPFILTPCEPSPLREPEPGVTACKWCGRPARQDYHAECREQWLAAKSVAHKAAQRAAARGLVLSGLWAFADPSDQGWHL